MGNIQFDVMPDNPQNLHFYFKVVKSLSCLYFF